ncbi:MAG: hypothetical protein JNJ49_02720 [Bdellovibrionaceae bacterium]|nr:hypothetical protein [Pseudobdellovibrionaceae bacterium]
MEFISLFILLPMFLSSSPEPVREPMALPSSVPRVEVATSEMRIEPPLDRSLAMTVFEYPASAGGRAPASVGERRIDVVVEAP